MNIGYVKIEKIKRREDNSLYNLLYRIIYEIHKLTNRVKQDKLYKNIFYITNFNAKSNEKLTRLLIKNNLLYAIVEDEKEIDYPSLDNNILTKYMLPEIIDYCFSKVNLENKEIYVLVDKYNTINIDIITELAKKVKVLNIVTENDLFRNLEKTLEKKDIYITVSSNKRKALKNAQLTINLDFKTITNYNINSSMILIDTTDEIIIPKFFNGILIRGLNIETKKIMRIFSDFENFNKQQLIQARIYEMNNYKEIRKMIVESKIYIINLKNKRIISDNEFKRIQKEKTIKQKSILTIN